RCVGLGGLGRGGFALRPIGAGRGRLPRRISRVVLRGGSRFRLILGGRLGLLRGRLLDRLGLLDGLGLLDRLRRRLGRESLRRDVVLGLFRLTGSGRELGVLDVILRGGVLGRGLVRRGRVRGIVRVFGR